MRYTILAATLLAIVIGAATLSACGPAGMGQQSLSGASMDWRRSNAVPAALVGDIVSRRRQLTPVVNTLRHSGGY